MSMKVKDLWYTCVTEQNGERLQKKVLKYLGKSLITEEMKISAWTDYM